MVHDELINLYNEELKSLQQKAVIFSEKHPEQASLLGISPNNIQDPMVKQLLQSFAYLAANARFEFEQAQQKIQKSFLKTLAPNLDYPIASMTILQFKIRMDESRLYIPKNTKILIKPKQNDACEFSSVYDLTLHSVDIYKCEYFKHEMGSQLNICCTTARNLNSIQKLRLFINLNLSHAMKLHHLIFENLCSLTFTSQELSIKLSPPIQIGFSDAEAILPFPLHILRSYRLIQEFFNYPEKFLFFDLTLPILDDCAIDNFTLSFEFTTHLKILEKEISQHSLLVNCCPFINIYNQDSEPIRLDSQTKQYRFLANQSKRIPQSIYTIEKLFILNSNGTKTEHFPNYHVHFNHQDKEQDLSWELAHHLNDQSSDYFIHLSSAPNENQKMMYAELLCCNHNYPHEQITQSANIIFKNCHFQSVASITFIKQPSKFTQSLMSSDLANPTLNIANFLRINQFFCSHNWHNALIALFKVFNQQAHPYLNQLANSIRNITHQQKDKSPSIISPFTTITIRLKEFEPNVNHSTCLFFQLIEQILNDQLAFEHEIKVAKDA